MLFLHLTENVICVQLQWYCFSSIEPQHNGCVLFRNYVSQREKQTKNSFGLANFFFCVFVVLNSFSVLSVCKYCTILTVHVFTIIWHVGLHTFVMMTP